MGDHRPEGCSPFALGYFQPAPDLRRYVSFYYLFRVDLPRIADVTRADVGQLRFMLEGRGDYTFGDGFVAATPEICLIGPSTAATHFAVDGPMVVFGAAILPAGWMTMVRSDATAHADRIEDGIAVFGAAMADALDALRNAPTVADMVAIVDAVIRDLSRRSAAPPFWFTQLTDDWLTDEANPAVDTLIERSGLSARHVERLAGRIYGAPPKLLARKYRALRAASLIGACDGAPDERMDDVFYDQSHAIREFKRFVGFTPGQLRRDPPPVMRLTRQRRALAGLVPTIAAVS